MKSSDLKYIYDNIPYQKMNQYPHNLNTNTILQISDKMKEIGYEYNLKKLKTGHHSIDMLRKDGSLAATLKNPIYPSNSKAGRRVAIDKLKTEKHLRSAGLNTTKSRLYTSDQMEKAKKEVFSDSDSGVVIKPLDMSLGKGVFVNVKEEDFALYWDKCTEVMKQTNRKEYYILVQDFMDGFEVRATILEGNLISIVARVPAFVIGDGVNTIEALIDDKNEERKKCGYLSKNQIKKSEAVKTFLKNSQYDFDTIPDAGEYVLLISVSNTSLGGEVVEVTDLVSTEIKELALNALAALPTMYCGGIDIMIRGFEDKNPGVIEINPFPVLSLTMFPTYGKPAQPVDYFLNAFFAKDQLINDNHDKYSLEDTKYYIQNYMKYYDRRERLQEVQQSH